MEDKKFDLLIFIGRMQPVHTEHKRIIETALKKSKNVLILVGSSGKARTIRNPFTFEERKEMIIGAINCSDNANLIIKPLSDKTYNDSAWIKQVQDIVKETALDIVNPSGFRINGIGEMKIGLIGASKDHTSFYLKMFPQWDSVNVPIIKEIHATQIREGFLNDALPVGIAKQVLPDNVIKFLLGDPKNNVLGFNDSDEFLKLQDEFNFVKKYKKQWESGNTDLKEIADKISSENLDQAAILSLLQSIKKVPYPVKHATVDVLLEQSGHVLLVKRRSSPGKGLWALPGGHLNEFETQLDGAIRELREETKIKVPEAVLRGNIVSNRTFDDPYRSTLGRVITQAYHIKLPDAVELPRVKGADDAEKAQWIPISELKEDMLFDDHHAIMCFFLGI